LRIILSKCRIYIVPCWHLRFFVVAPYYHTFKRVSIKISKKVLRLFHKIHSDYCDYSGILSATIERLSQKKPCDYSATIEKNFRKRSATIERLLRSLVGVRGRWCVGVCACGHGCRRVPGARACGDRVRGGDPSGDLYGGSGCQVAPFPSWMIRKAFFCLL
jgi:hypothetical protein